MNFKSNTVFIEKMENDNVMCSPEAILKSRRGTL